jgi:hypothetical protein
MGKGPKDKSSVEKKANKVARTAKHKYSIAQAQADAQLIVSTSFGVIATFLVWLLGGTQSVLENMGLVAEGHEHTLTNGVAIASMLLVQYVLFGLIFNLTMPSHLGQMIVPLWVCHIWRRMQPADSVMGPTADE